MLEQYAGASNHVPPCHGHCLLACFVMTSLLGPKRKFADKMEPFECGESQLVSPHQRFSVKFYLVAVLFVLFDIEAYFLFPLGHSVQRDWECTALLKCFCSFSSSALAFYMSGNAAPWIGSDPLARKVYSKGSS